MLKNSYILKSFSYPFNIEEIRLCCKDKSGVYMILNEINGDSYIGSGSSSKKNHNRVYIRFTNHLINRTNSNKNLQKAIRKYGIKNFSFNILTFTKGNSLEAEQYFLDTLKPKYNDLERADSSYGYKHTPETKRKMKQNYSLEKRLKIGNLNKGKSLPESVKKQLSGKAKIRNKDPIFKEKHKKSVQNVSYKFSKPVKVLDGTTREHIITLPSIRSVQKYYNFRVSYRHLKRRVSKNKIIKKLNILLEYI